MSDPCEYLELRRRSILCVCTSKLAVVVSSFAQLQRGRSFRHFGKFFAGMPEPHLLFFFCFPVFFTNEPKLKIDFPRPRVMHGRYHMFGE